MTLAQVLAGPPTLLGWRRICAALDAQVLEVEAVEVACAGWPDCNRLGGAAIAALVTGPLLDGVKLLNLSNNPIGALGCAALAGCPGLAGLEVLYLHGCGLDDAAASALLAAPWLPRLANLALSANALSMATVDRLAGHGGLALGELDICHNPGILEAAAEPVLRAALAGMHRLCL